MKFPGETDAVIISEAPKKKRAPLKRRATLQRIETATITPAELSKLESDLKKRQAAAVAFIKDAQKIAKVAKKNPFGALMSVLAEVAAHQRKVK